MVPSIYGENMFDDFFDGSFFGGHSPLFGKHARNLMKTDILKEVMYFSYDKGSLANLFPLAASEVREIIKMNRNGVKPESLKTEPEPEMPEFITAVGDDSITRFDAPNRKKRKNQQRGRQNDKPQAKQKVKENAEAQQPEVNADVQDRPQRQQQDGRRNGRQRRQFNGAQEGNQNRQDNRPENRQNQQGRPRRGPRPQKPSGNAQNEN